MKTNSLKATEASRSASKGDPNRYPKGLNRNRVAAILSHYENQTDDAAIAEDEAAYNSTTSTMIEVPLELVGKVEKLIAKSSE